MSRKSGLGSRQAWKTRHSGANEIGISRAEKPHASLRGDDGKNYLDFAHRQTFAFALEFVGDYLTNLHDSLESEVFKLRVLLGEFQEFIDGRMAEIQGKIDNAYLVVQCPVCLQQALELGDGPSHCLSCEMCAEGELAARQWVNRFFGFQSREDSLVSPQIETCTECGAEACVDMGQETDGEINYVCFGCGQSGDYKHCSDCNSLHESDHPSDRCDDCWSDLMARND